MIAAPIGAVATNYIGPLLLVEGTQTPDSGSHIELKRVVVLRYIPQIEPSGEIETEPAYVECIEFVNHDARTVGRMIVRYSYRGADGIEEGSDTLDLRGTFTPGRTFGDVSPSEPVSPRVANGEACRAVAGFGRRGDGRHVDYGPYYRRVTVTASVREVDYKDGTSWSEPTPAPAPSSPKESLP